MPIIKDMAFLGYELSDNLAESPEGFLICQNVPIARTGVQYYLSDEMGLNGATATKIKVYRLEEDVFNEATLKSFEGKPVTNDHPTDAEVTPDNAGLYAKGHLQNVRRSGIYIVADLVVTDAFLIELIKTKQKREVSAGYRCDWEPHKDGYKQTNITGNHVAVVDKGRAGPKVSIKDRDSLVKSNKGNKGVKRAMKSSRQEILSRMLAVFAKDGDTTAEELEAATSLLVNDSKDSESSMFKNLLSLLAIKDKKAKDEDEEEKEDKEEEEKAKDKKAKDALSKRLDSLEKAIDSLAKALDKKAMDEDEEEKAKAEDSEEEEEEAYDKAKDKKAKDKAKDEDEEEEEEEEEKAKDKKAKDSALKLALANLNAKDRAMMKKALGLNRDGAAYSDIMRAVENNKKSTKDSKPLNPSALGESIMDKYNLGVISAKK